MLVFLALKAFIGSQGMPSGLVGGAETKEGGGAEQKRIMEVAKITAIWFLGWIRLGY